MSHEVQVQKLTDIMAQFVGFTAKKLPDDVIAKLEELRAQEDSPMATVIYDTMFRNQELAIKLDRPSCQDTGVLGAAEGSSRESNVCDTAAPQLRRDF